MPTSDEDLKDLAVAVNELLVFEINRLRALSILTSEEREALKYLLDRKAKVDSFIERIYGGKKNGNFD